MLSLLLTLFISLFSICPAYNQVDQLENNTFIDDSVSTPIQKNAFMQDDYDGEGNFAYVMSFQDIAGTSAFLDARQYFKDYGNYDIDDDNSIMPINTSYTIPIKPVDVATFYFFDYAAGYPYSTTSYLTFNYMKITKTNVANRNSFYTLYFMPAVDSPSGQYVSFSYRKTLDFDYVISCTIDVFSSSQSNDYCLIGVSDTSSNVPYLTLYEIFSSVNNRTVNEESYQRGYTGGYTAGYDTGYNEGYYNGEQAGYNEGLAHADYDSTALTIMQGIIDVGLLPVNVFLLILNFEVFGVNISGFVSALLTISIVIIIVRFLFGGKNNDK